jgi:hypothetical protein
VKVIARDILENCFEGDFVVNYTFDTSWTKDTIYALKPLGQLKYYETFPRPMFQVTSSGGHFIKGVQGTCECRVIYARDETDENSKNFEKRFEELIDFF